jgi:NADPH:quinone reductase-like Zn-dependent oxidoreductase
LALELRGGRLEALHMKAIVQDTYGSTDVLQPRDIDRPRIADDEVLVRVHAAGVDRGAWHVMTGLPYPIRLAGYGLRAPKTRVPGMDVAGVVEAVGDDVSRFRPGDEVFGIGKGAYAEYARASESKLAPKPANLTFEQVAVVAVSGPPALQGLRDHGKVRPGQDALVIGASGGMGTSAVQLAKGFGAEVTAVCSAAKVDMVRSIGADHVIDYAHEDSRFGSQSLGTFISRESHEDMIVLKELIESGKVTPVVDRAYSVSEVPEALRHLEQGHARGKVVITV